MRSDFRVVITPGEPAGIGPDLAIQLAQQSWPVELVVCASPQLLRERAALLGLPLTLRDYQPAVAAQPQQAGTLTVLPVDTGHNFDEVIAFRDAVVERYGLTLEVASVQLNSASEGGADDDDADVPFTACLALWGLCMLAGDEPAPGHAPWRADIGAPAEGTRRKALPRDDWMPQPQLAEKREAKRARGWVLPEDPVGRKELGKRGVRYGAC